MAGRCVNIQHEDFKKLAAAIGVPMAKSVTVANDYKIPSVEEATNIIKGTKIKQFKKALSHIKDLKTPSVDELFKGFNGIVRKHGKNWFIVNGSRIAEKPTSLNASVIEKPTINFLEAINKMVGKVFNIYTDTTRSMAFDKNFLNEIEAVVKDNAYLEIINQAKAMNDYKLGVDYFVDKAVENPILFDKNLGQEMTDRLLNMASDAKIQSAIEYLSKQDPTSNSIDVLNKVLNDRQRLSVNNSGKTQGFFSDVVSGKSEKFKPKKEWVSILPFNQIESAFKAVYDKFKGNFDNHIAASIPTFRETQIKVGSAITDLYADKTLSLKEKKTNSDLLKVKDDYLLSAGIISVAKPYTKVNKELFAKLADYHKNVKDDRLNPEMAKSYRAFMNETKAQYEALVRAGYVIEPWMKEGEPYGVDSNLLRKDIEENKHLYYLRSKSATGQNEENQDAENYLPFEESGIVINGDNVLMNDLFRAVHDIMGHGLVNNSFSTQGELDAYKTHAAMYSQEAQKALFLETVMYNAWYSVNKNYGPRKIYDIPQEFISEINSDVKSSLVYDIGGSEGGFVKAITEMSGGSIRSINLDINEEMEKAHNARPVPGSEYVKEAFFEEYIDGLTSQQIDDLQHVYGNSLPQLFMTAQDMLIDEEASERLNRISDQMPFDETGTVDVATIKTLSQALVQEPNQANIDALLPVLKDNIKAISEAKPGPVYVKHVPSEKADVVHESMVFQFISPERKQFIKEIKDNYIKPDGIVLLEEKVLPETEEQWKQNEAKKDAYKLQYFPQEAITEKAEQVLVGMKANQTAEKELVDTLSSNFAHVAMYWDAGNFKGYIASDSKEAVDNFLNKLGGTITSVYSASTTENVVAGRKVMSVTDGQQYYDAITAAMALREQDSVQLTPNDAAYYQKIVDEGGVLLLSEDNMFGGYVTADGYMGGLFKNPSVSDKIAKPMQELRIAMGGRYMDAYATLENGYVRNGFKAVARLPFNEQYAPENWENTVLKSRPDVVFFAYSPETRNVVGEGETVSTYDEGMDKAKNFEPADNIQAVKVEVNEEVLADLTQRNQESVETDTIDWTQFNENDAFQKINEDQWTAEQKKRFAIDNVIRMLKLKFGLKVKVVNEPGSYWRGKYSNGVVFINQAYFTPDTAFHEFLHPFIDVLKRDNPELYNAMMDEFKNSEESKQIIDYVRRAYPELTEQEQWDEALVQRLGELSASKYLNTSAEKGVWGRFTDWLRTLLAKIGISTASFTPNMSMVEFSELIINPAFVFDLSRKIDSENYAERFSRLSNTFDDVANRVREKLRADAASRSKNMTEDTSKRKFFSGKMADALTENLRDLKAIDSFVLSAAINLKKLNEKFEAFKQQFDAKPVKTQKDITELGALLNEIEDCVTLYEDVDLLLNAVMDEFPDADDAIGNLKKNYSKEAALINNYKSYARELIVNWLFPHAKSAINKALATGKPHTVVSKNMYEAVQKELQAKNITDKRTILETAFKRELASYLTTAKKDASAVTQFLGPLLHSRDPLSALIGRAVVEEYTGALKKGLQIQDRLSKLVRQVRGVQIFNTNQDHFNFYQKYLRQAISYEYQGLDENGEHSYKEVKRWAFHEEYKWDEFYKAKREMEKSIGVAPSKHDIANWNAWKTKRDSWYAANTVASSKGTIPSSKYKNPDFAALQGDKLFVEMYKAYKEANNKVGAQGLKYGIIPQDTVLNLKAEKGKRVQTAIEKLRLFIGEEDQVYFAQKNNLKEKKTVPVAFTRMVDENDLSFDLLNSITKYAVSAEKYTSISNIEPHVNILKNFIGGNASLGIDARQVVKVSASGIKALSKAERKAMQVEATRINNQLDAFLNDVIYGQPMKKQTIQLYNSKFRVVDANGKEEIIKGFDNLTEYIQIPDLDYNGFEVGTERKLKDYKVTMLRKDWNWSVKKGANTLGLVTAFTQLALNPVSAVINVVRAKLETFIEGAGGRYFTLNDALKAEGIYFRALGSGDFFEDFKGGKQSFLSTMLIDYDAIQGELMDELGKKIPGSLAAKLFRRNHLFFMQQGGEHYVQTQLMIALMLHKKVKLKSGGEISLYEAKKREHEGTLNMSDTNWTEQDDVDFRQEVKFVNTNMHGNYNKLDKAYLQRTWWGSLLMMFRKHIYTGFASRYRGVFGQGGYVNYQTGNYTEGYYLTFFKGLVGQVQSLIERKRMNQMSEDEKYAFKKIAADFASLALMMMAFKMFDDDDDEEEFNDYMALISRRLISEGVQYTPVVGTMDLAKIVTNPAASVSTVDKIWEAVSQSISDPTAEYERSGPGYKVGQNKAAVKWGRAIPLYRQYVNTVEPERLLQFYGKNSIWFLKPSAGRDGETEE